MLLWSNWNNCGNSHSKRNLAEGGGKEGDKEAGQKLRQNNSACSRVLALTRSATKPTDLLIQPGASFHSTEIRVSWANCDSYYCFCIGQ